MARRPYAPSTDGSRKVSLAKLETDGTTHLRKEAGLEELETWGAELGELSNLLSYARQHALLVVLQGRRDPQDPRCFEHSKHRRRALRSAHRAGARARLPVARPPRSPAARSRRPLQ